MKKKELRWVGILIGLLIFLNIVSISLLSILTTLLAKEGETETWQGVFTKHGWVVHNESPTFISPYVYNAITFLRMHDGKVPFILSTLDGKYCCMMVYVPKAVIDKSLWNMGERFLLYEYDHKETPPDEMYGDVVVVLAEKVLSKQYILVECRWYENKRKHVWTKVTPMLWMPVVRVNDRVEIDNSLW